MTWERQRLWKKDEHENKGKRSSKGRTTPTENDWPSEFRGLCLGPATLLCQNLSPYKTLTREVSGDGLMCIPARRGLTK